jgi:hypothetical protein
MLKGKVPRDFEVQYVFFVSIDGSQVAALREHVCMLFEFKFFIKFFDFRVSA